MCLDECQRRFILKSRPAISGKVTIMFHRRSILKVHPERTGDALAILSPHLLKALSYRLWGKHVELFFRSDGYRCGLYFCC